MPIVVALFERVLAREGALVSRGRNQQFQGFEDVGFIAGHADVKSSIPSAGKNVNSWLYFFLHRGVLFRRCIFLSPRRKPLLDSHIFSRTADGLNQSKPLT